MRKSAAVCEAAKAGACHHGLAPNERALPLARRPSRAGGSTLTRAARHARAASARAAPPPHSERARWCARMCAHAQISRPCGTRPRPACGTTALYRTREAFSLVRRPFGFRGRISTRAARCARAASARAASPPHRERAPWLAHVCAHAQASRPCARRRGLVTTPVWREPRSHGRRKTANPLPGRTPSSAVPHRSASPALCPCGHAASFRRRASSFVRGVPARVQAPRAGGAGSRVQGRSRRP